MPRTLIAITLLAGAVFSWSAATASGSCPAATTRHSHPSGLRVCLSRAYEVEVTRKGLRVRNKAWINTRYPKRATVYLMRGKSRAHNGRTRRVIKTTDGRRNLVLFRIEKLNGGSGGPEYRFRGVRREVSAGSAAAGAIVVEQQDQIELGTPNFALAWILLRSAESGQPTPGKRK